MFKGQNEIRMMWLMLLIIVGIGAWFLNIHALAYLCGIGLIVSVIQYVDVIEKPTQAIAQQSQVKLIYTSRIPLYIASIIAVVGGLIHLNWMLALGMTLWLFFFLRWLRRLENNLNLLQYRVNQDSHQSREHFTPSSTPQNLQADTPSSAHIQADSSHRQDIGLLQHMQQWIFAGNPVLKAAILILVIGVILLLRFATEHWQLSLAFKLAIVAGVSGFVTVVGYLLIVKNRSFALALEGLGLAGLFLTLFFANYNHVIPSLFSAGMCFVLIMAITLSLSLKQQTIELALMAMLIAYIVPFTLPVRDATAVELVAYYLVINLAVAILSTLRPWKILNQIAFLATTVIGGMYALIHGDVHERNMMTILVIAHTAIFVWLSFRFSQLIAKSDVEKFRLKPALDITLIFSAPIVGYICIYLMYFDENIWQALSSLGFAVVYAGLYQLSKRNRVIGLISQSYFSLMLIFLALIPPILLPEQWSVMGWAIEGAFIYLLALQRSSTISRYLAMGLLIVAGLSGLYEWLNSTTFPSTMFWILSLSYLMVVLGANVLDKFRQQLSFISVLFLSMLMLSVSIMWMMLLLDYFTGVNQYVHTLMIVSAILFIFNEMMLRTRATWTWLLPKWFALVPLLVFALYIVINASHQGVIFWHSGLERLEYLLACVLMTGLWLRPMHEVRTEKEWVSLGAMLSLAMASLVLFPQMPFMSVVILPLLFCAWSYRQSAVPDWQIFWQTRSTLLLTMVWIVCSQLFSQQAFQGYVLPILNPFDMVSLAVLAGFIWVLTLQMKHGLDKGIVAVLMVLSLLWLSSYIVLRALHMYLATPYNDLALWGNAVVQLSLTLLWVSLAFITMSLASRKKLRPMWILGGSILAVVTLKLVLFDLSHVGTFMRVLSFLGAGTVMLIIAYIAPMPDSDQSLVSKSNET